MQFLPRALQKLAHSGSPIGTAEIDTLRDIYLDEVQKVHGKKAFKAPRDIHFNYRSAPITWPISGHLELFDFCVNNWLREWSIGSPQLPFMKVVEIFNQK